MVGALRKFLVDREEQERKRFLDDITATREQRLGENAQAATEVARENALSLKDARESTGKLREQQIAKSELDTFTGQHLPGDEVSNADAAKFPGVVKAGSVTQGAHLGTDESGVDQYDVTEKKPEYQGTGDQRTAEAERQAKVMYVNSLPPGPQKEFLTAQIKTGDKTLPYQMFEPKTPEDVYAVDPRAKTVNKIGEVPKGSHMSTVPQPNQTAAAAGATNADGLDMMAWQYLQTGQMPTRNAALIGPIANRAAALKNEHGLQDPSAAGAEYGADKTSLAQVTKQITAVKSFKDTAKKNIAVLKDTLDDLPDAGASILNRPFRSLSGMVGNTDMARFNAALGTVQPELSRILNSANLTGVNTVHAQQEVEKMLDSNYTVGQMLAALEVLEQDMNNRETSMNDMKASIRSSITSRGSAGHTGEKPPAEAPAPAAAPAAPAPARGKYKVTVR